MDVDLDARLAACERDVRTWTVQETVRSLRALQQSVVADVQCAQAPATRLGAYASVVVMAVDHILHHVDDAPLQRDAWLNDCTELMEECVVMAFYALRERLSTTTCADKTSRRPFPSSSRVDAARLCGYFTQLLTMNKNPRAAAAWIDLGVLFALIWIVQAKTETSPRDLLIAIVTHCRVHQHLKRHIVRPLLILALVVAVRQRDETRALQYLDEAVTVARSHEGDQAVDSLLYWNAVLRSRLNDSPTSAIDMLRAAIANNTHVVESLQLQALLAMARREWMDAAAALERCVELEDEGVSLFNYALLLERMGNREAQYQMLTYCEQAVAMRTTDASETEDETKRTPHKAQPLDLFTDAEITRLYACQRQTIDRRDVALKMAMAATASGQWYDACERFEAYFSALNGNEAIVSQATRRSFVYALLQCNRPTDALTQCDRAPPDDLWIAFYKADALLCLERVDECHAHLQHDIQPRLTRQLQSENASDDEELVALHKQLLNNLAVATVCCGDADRAVTMLRDASRAYPTDLTLQFNLTLLLWRLERREAACALWFQARGWDLQMDMSDLRKQEHALEMVERMEDEVLSARTQRPVTSHVSDMATTTSGDVDDQRLRFLDVLVLHHWSQQQSSLVATTAAQYVDYLQTLRSK